MECSREDSGLTDDASNASQAQRSSPLSAGRGSAADEEAAWACCLIISSHPASSTYCRWYDTTPVTNRADKQTGRARITRDREASKPSAEDWMR